MSPLIHRSLATVLLADTKEEQQFAPQKSLQQLRYQQLLGTFACIKRTSFPVPILRNWSRIPCIQPHIDKGALAVDSGVHFVRRGTSFWPWLGLSSGTPWPEPRATNSRVGIRCSQWRALSARSSGRQKRKPFPILLQMCFSLLFIAFRVRIVHQRPLCIWSPSTKPPTQKRPYAQLPSTIPRHRVIQPSFFCSFLLKYHVPLTWLCCNV